MYVALVLPSDTACASVVHCIPLTRDAIILHCPVAKTCKQLGFSYTEQSHSQWFYTGGHKAARVHFFLKKSWWPFLVVALSSKVHIFGIFEAHRTLLVERAVLLYWIKQALCPNKASFFRKKNPLNRRLEAYPPPRLRPCVLHVLQYFHNLFRKKARKMKSQSQKLERPNSHVRPILRVKLGTRPTGDIVWLLRMWWSYLLTSFYCDV